jgi:hypothetical protein
MKNTLGKRTIFSLHGPNQSADPTCEAKPARFSSPSLLSLPSGPRVPVEPTYRLRPVCVKPTYWGISPSNSPTRTCSSRRRQSTAAARPSGHLGACRDCCRATPPVRMPQAALSPRTTELSLRATAQRARCCACYAAMVPGASRSTTPSCSAHCRNLLPLPCARRLDAELSARARVGPLHSLHLPRTCHRVAASA